MLNSASNFGYDLLARVCSGLTIAQTETPPTDTVVPASAAAQQTTSTTAPTTPLVIAPTNSWAWDQWAAAISTPFICLIGIALTAITLPGNWLIVLWAFIIKLSQPEVVSWWSLVALVALAGLGEGLEFLASALGASKAGGTKHGAIGAMLGSLVGAIVGIVVPPPIVGSIVCAALGAATGAVVGERYINKRSWQESGKVAAGAAIGRVIAMFAKILIAAIMSLLLCLAVVVS
ncbi:MAG: DUF456 domain-containing protein [Phycisphaerales bacterium]